MRKVSVRKPKLNLDVLLTKIVALLVRFDYKDLTYSLIARRSEVPRSTLYYYFGKDLDKVVLEAVGFAMKKFLQIEEFKEIQKFESWDSFQIERLSTTLKRVREHPWAAQVYFKYRQDKGYVGARIRELEDNYSISLGHAWKYFQKTNADPKVIRLTNYLKLGLVFGVSSEVEIWKKGKDSRDAQIIKWVNKIVVDALTNL